MPEYSDGTQDAAGQRALAAALQRKAAERERRKYLAHLRHLLAKRLTRTQLDEICYDLGVHDELPDDSQSERALALMDRLEKEDRIEELVQVAQNKRPDLNWTGAESIPSSTTTYTRAVRPAGRAAAELAPAPFDRDVAAEARARIIKRMSSVLNELESYVEQYGEVTKALQTSIRLQEKLEKLKSISMSGAVWELYLDSLEPYYKDLNQTALAIRNWHQSRLEASTAQPVSDGTITQELWVTLRAKEHDVLALIENYLQFHQTVCSLREQLRKLQVSAIPNITVEKEPHIVQLREQLDRMQEHADNIALRLYAIITNLIKKELNAQLAELRGLRRQRRR